MQSPFFSIIIPTYNRVHILQEAINGTLNQTFEDFELIISDDGSTDGTNKMVEASTDARVKYLFHPNQGVCSARNEGAKQAKGEFLIFLDSDDQVAPSWLADFYTQIMAKNASLVFADITKIFPNRKKTELIRAAYPYNGKPGNGLFLCGAFCLSAPLFWKAGGYDPLMTYGENTELSFRVFQHRPVCAFTNKVGLFYHLSNEGGSKNMKNLLASNLYILKKHEAIFLSNKKMTRLYLQNTGVAAIRLGEIRQGKALILKALKLQPLYLKNWFRLLCLVHPSVSKLVWPLNN
jgi:glycosyltransferase involved in cell wall biosynthesis